MSTQSRGLRTLMRNLRTRAESGDPIRWERRGDTEIRLHLSNLDITIARNSVADQADSPPEFRVIAEVSGRSESRKEEFDRGSDGYDDVSALFTTAVEPSIDEILEEVASCVADESGPIGTVPGVFPPIPPVPPDPTPEQISAFFRKISGKWLLDFERGTERVKIATEGQYFYLSNPDRTLRTQPKFAFRLELVRCDEALHRVEIAKRDEAGNIRELEVLNVTENAMTGYSKRDGRRLSYVREK